MSWLKRPLSKSGRAAMSSGVRISPSPPSFIMCIYLKKFFFILNNLPEYSDFKEEILGMQPIVLRGNLCSIE